MRSVTVVVPTFRRPEGLVRALQGLAGQQDPGVPWDVVVVDNDDPPGADTAFAAACEGLSVPARIVREQARGASHARNRGIAEATGDIVAFLDDDVVVAPDWLRELTAPIRAGRCDGTGGRVLLDPSVPRPVWFDEANMGPYLAAHDPAIEEREIRDGEYLITASAAFRREVLTASGGFDPELGPRERTQLVNDDVALGDRVKALGGRLHHVPAAVAVHDLPAARLRVRYLVRRAHTQGRSDWILHTRTVGRREAVRSQLRWARHEARERWRDGIWRRRVAVQALTDVARLAGAAREALQRARHGFR